MPVTVAGTFAYTSTAGSLLGAGAGQSEAVTFTPTDTSDYTTAATTVTVNVAPATPTVSVNAVNVIYGTALANGQLTGTASWTDGGQSVTVAGTFTYTSAAGSVVGAGTGQSEAVTFTPTDANDYTTAATTVTVNVAQATPTVSVNAVNLTYGTALANSQLAGAPPGPSAGNPRRWPALSLTPAPPAAWSGWAPARVELSLSLPRTPTTTRQSAQPRPSTSPATPTVSVNAVNLTYGTALANGQLSGTATWVVGGNSVTVAGTFAYTSAAGTVLGAGNGQSEAVTFTGHGHE